MIRAMENAVGWKKCTIIWIKGLMAFGRLKLGKKLFNTYVLSKVSMDSLSVAYAVVDSFRLCKIKKAIRNASMTSA